MPPLGWRKAVDGGVKGTKGKQSAEHSDSPSTTPNPPLVPERSGVAILALGGTLGTLHTKQERGTLNLQHKILTLTDCFYDRFATVHS